MPKVWQGYDSGAIENTGQDTNFSKHPRIDHARRTARSVRWL